MISLRVQDIVVFKISGASFYCVGPLFSLVLVFLPYLLPFPILEDSDLHFSPSSVSGPNYYISFNTLILKHKRKIGIGCTQIFYLCVAMVIL